MRQLVLILGCCLFGAGLAAGGKRADPLAGLPSGLQWRDLCEGEEIARWSIIGRESEDAPAWMVESGRIVGDTTSGPPSKRQWLIHSEEWENFVVSLEFQLSAEYPSNSGLHFRSRFYEKSGWMLGSLVAIDSDRLYKNAMVWDSATDRSCWFSPRIPKGERPTAALASPLLQVSTEPGNWNRLVLILEGGRARIYINDALVNAFDGSETWSDAKHQELGIGMKGHLAFEIDRKRPARFVYRKIHVAELP